MKFEIKSWLTGSILFSLETDSLKLCVEAAVKSRADLYGANLSGANLSRADLYGANLSGANLYGANLSGANLSRANLSRANLSGANLSGANLSGANLSGANLYGANLSGANLSRANLSGANLSRADLYGANLSGANLYGANLSGANLSRANLSRANLSGANLSGANLSGANLSGANLYGANLSGANLSRANLSRANLSGVNLYGVENAIAEICTPLRILLEQTGKIRAYKLVDADGTGPFKGGIVYKIGESIEVKDASIDESIQCDKGINVATLDWCLKEWKEGYKVLIVEFTAKDIACIPIATDGKFRLHRCKVVGEKDIADILKRLHPKEVDRIKEEIDHE